MGCLEYTRARLQRLSAKELASVQNIPAYIFTLLSKRGRTAKQAAAAKTAAEQALAAFPSPTPSSPLFHGSGLGGGLVGLSQGLHLQPPTSQFGLGRVGSGGLTPHQLVPHTPGPHPHYPHTFPPPSPLGGSSPHQGAASLRRQMSGGWAAGTHPSPPHPLISRHKYGSASTTALFSHLPPSPPISTASHPPLSPSALRAWQLAESVMGQGQGLGGGALHQWTGSGGVWGCGHSASSPSPAFSPESCGRPLSNLGLAGRASSAVPGWN